MRKLTFTATDDGKFTLDNESSYGVAPTEVFELWDDGVLALNEAVVRMERERAATAYTGGAVHIEGVTNMPDDAA